MRFRKIINNVRYLIMIMVLPVLLAALLFGCGKKNDADAGSTDSQDAVNEEIMNEEIVSGESNTGNANIDDDDDWGEDDRDDNDREDDRSDRDDDDREDDRDGLTGQSRPSDTTGTPFEKYGALAVEGTNLVDEKGNSVQLRGVSTAGLSWFPQFSNKDAFATMRDEWGVEIVRLAMYTAEYNGYCVGDAANKEKLRDLVEDSVEAATELGLYVIIDWHILSDGNPNTYKAEAIDFFTEMTDEFEDYDNVIYELCNEPNGGTSWSDIKSYAEEVIPVIRSYDKNAIILVGTPTWSQDVDQAAADPITGYDNLMYTLHFYAATHKESLRNKMVDAIEDGLPIFVSEFGICSASGDGALDYTEAANWIATLDKNNISYCSWNLSNKNETSALLASTTNKTSGWTTEDLSEYGKWLVQVLNGDLDRVGTVSQGSGGTAFGNTGSGNGSQGNAGGSAAGNGSFGNTLPAPAVSSNSTELQATATVTNAWTSGDKYYYQYDINIENLTESTKKDWTLTITFSEKVAVDQSWSCTQSVSGKTVTITAAEWNQTIEASSSLKDIGMILCFTKESTIQEIHI